MALRETHETRDPNRLSAALRLVVQRYAAQLRRWPSLTIGALLLPALGDVLTFYAPPLLIARLLAAFARNQRFTVPGLIPYVLTFAAFWLGGQVFWRIAVAYIIRIELYGMQSPYIEALDELLAKDLLFFQNNYAGSLTKRALGYARRFEDVFDALSFQIASTVFPLVFVSVVLWTYSPWLVALLMGMLAITVLLVFP